MQEKKTHLKYGKFSTKNESTLNLKKANTPNANYPYF